MIWITSLLIPLLTITLSGVVSSFVTFRLAAIKAERDFRLKKLEKMLEALERFTQSYIPYLMTHLPILTTLHSDEDQEKAFKAAKEMEEKRNELA